jgi:hypothetical protein
MLPLLNSNRRSDIADEPVDEFLAKPGAPYPMLKASLAEYAALVAQTNESRRLVRSARSRTAQQYFLTALQSADALFLANLLDGNLNAALSAGIGYARILSLGAAVLKDLKSEQTVALEKIDLDRLLSENASAVIEKCRENVPAFVLAPLFAGTWASKDIPRPNLAIWRRQISDAFGASDRLSEAIGILEVGFRATVDENEEDIRRIKQLTSYPIELHEHLRILPLVISCALNPADLRELLSFQASILLDHAKWLRGVVCWHAVFCRMVATRWRIIAETQPFRLVGPRVMVNAIIRAASSQLFVLPHCAGLLLVAAQAVGATWPSGVREQLNLISLQLNS